MGITVFIVLGITVFIVLGINVFVTGYTKTGLIAQNKIFYLVIWANRRIFYLSFETLNVYVGHTITKIEPFKPGQS